MVQMKHGNLYVILKVVALYIPHGSDETVDCMFLSTICIALYPTWFR
ncbi:hypothetical protein THEYE_A2024 [Thermodesulfovibrio yellowstonii DSM 11347]|uniref:Uncharacterized protein n=1 Tax=Thermodesulfovibrio yellowstonii (strain ATCC 51303 / DSM 11347 / YP87) TaxID=289376 RepID=B5YIT7_THEYD|nr:hypothetical protein THEYE_A2024 [Thermodesulfovibrio yellowstonii DSM 11347]